MKKSRRSELGATLSLELVTNPDIIAGIDEPGLLKIGFAAETSNLVEHARKKLAQKSVWTWWLRTMPNRQSATVTIESRWFGPMAESMRCR